MPNCAKPAVCWLHLRSCLPSASLLVFSWYKFSLSTVIKHLKEMLDIFSRILDHQLDDLFNHLLCR